MLEQRFYVIVAAVTFVIIDDYLRDWLFTTFSNSQLIIIALIGSVLIWNYYMETGETPT